jgi:hypothetical protein
MKTNTILSLGLAMFMGAASILPAAAATTAAPAKPAAATAPTTAKSAMSKSSHFYVSLKQKGAGCEIVEVKPTTKLMVGKHSYKSEADAHKAMAAAKACKA